MEQQTTTIMSPETTRNAAEEWERIIQNPLNFTETIIPSLWSDDLHSKLFASTASSQLPRRISVVFPTATTASNATTIRTMQIARRITMTTASIETETEIASPTTATKTSAFGHNSISSTHLASKLAGDALVAVAVTFVTSPFLTVVDKAIVESTAGTNSILSSSVNSLKSMARNPIEYIRSPTFLLMWAVYSATYTTANVFKTLEEQATYSRDVSKSNSDSSSNVDDTANRNSSAGMFTMAAFLGTTVVNSSASMLKDRAYARMFSGTTSSTSFPRSTYALWMMRDLSVIGSSFLLPDLVSAKMVDYYDGDMDRERARNLCQIGLPVLAQFVASPFQYLGLDLYNRSLSGLTTTQAIVDRSKKMSRGIAPVIAARIARIIPGYSIGGVANTKLRKAWREKLLERDVAAMMKNNSGNKSKGSNATGATRMVALLHSSNHIGDKKGRS